MNIAQIIRSRRKTIAIVVHADGRVIVRAPQRLSETRILAFIAEKQTWIEKKLAQTRIQKNQVSPRMYQTGEALPFMGRLVPIEMVVDSKSPIVYTGDKFLIKQVDRDSAEQIVTAWYRQQARKIIQERIDRYADQFHFQYTRVRISSARTRWGSCSSRGTLSICWRLVMAPLHILDYVVLHELTHLVEPNHSSRFWERLAAMMPDYHQRRSWLKACGPAFSLHHLVNIESYPCLSK